MVAVACTTLRSHMPRRSLRPELNRIRAWVRQGRTDAWIAHQLEVTVQQIQAFKREQSLEAGDDAEGAGPAADFDADIDLRAEDDALIAAELDAVEAASDDDADEGYGLWLDPAVQDDPIYAEHWAGHRPVEVAIEEDQIVIRRSGEPDADDG